MKRKLLAALCVTVMSAGLLAGCGSSDKTEESTKTEETAKEETSSQEETETKAASSDSDNVASEEEAEKAQKSAKELFSAGNAANMPTAELAEEDFTDGNIDILTLLVKSTLVPSKSEGRRAVQQGGVAVDGEKVEDIATTFTKADFEGEGKVLRRGKKNFRKVEM